MFDSAKSRRLAVRIRQHVLRMVHRANVSHVGSSLSMADLLAVLYSGTLQIDPGQPDHPDRDRLIVSKGHGAAGVYAVLAERGFIPAAWLETFCQNGSPLAGHVTSHGVPGVEISTGSLGHGLPIGCGIALALIRGRQPSRVFVVLSDGECDEGSTWEAALFAPCHNLDNLVAIIDYNTIQGFGVVPDVLDLEPFAAKWQSFGWATREVDGHNHAQIAKALAVIPFKPNRPSVLIAHTIKGKGVSFMESQLAWHYWSVNVDQLAQALTEVEYDANRIY